MSMKLRAMARGTALALALACTAGGAFAQGHSQSPELQRVQTAVQKALGASNPIKSVNKTPLPGIYEINVGSDIVYSDASGRYLLMGDLVDTRTRESLTQARLAELNKIDFAKLPLDQAIKYVKGNGSRKIAVFSDPNCPYCKRFEQTLRDSVDNITVYTFLYPVLSPDSTVKSKAIWCSSDRLKAWHAWMLDKQAPGGKGDCATPVDQNRALGEQLNVTGTPTIFLADGRRLPGAVTAEQLEKALATVK